MNNDYILYSVEKNEGFFLGGLNYVLNYIKSNEEINEKGLNDSLVKDDKFQTINGDIKEIIRKILTLGKSLKIISSDDLLEQDESIPEVIMIGSYSYDDSLINFPCKFSDFWFY